MQRRAVGSGVIGRSTLDARPALASAPTSQQPGPAGKALTDVHRHSIPSTRRADAARRSSNSDALPSAKAAGRSPIIGKASIPRADLAAIISMRLRYDGELHDAQKPLRRSRAAIRRSRAGPVRQQRQAGVFRTMKAQSEFKLSVSEASRTGKAGARNARPMSASCTPCSQAPIHEGLACRRPPASPADAQQPAPQPTCSQDALHPFALAHE